MNKDNGVGCGFVVIAVIVGLLVLYLAGGFLGNLFNYNSSGNKVAANASFFFLVALVIVVYLIYRFLKSMK